MIFCVDAQNMKMMKICEIRNYEFLDLSHFICYRRKDRFLNCRFKYIAFESYIIIHQLFMVYIISALLFPGDSTIGFVQVPIGTFLRGIPEV